MQIDYAKILSAFGSNVTPRRDSKKIKRKIYSNKPDRQLNKMTLIAASDWVRTMKTRQCTVKTQYMVTRTLLESRARIKHSKCRFSFDFPDMKLVFWRLLFFMEFCGFVFADYPIVVVLSSVVSMVLVCEYGSYIFGVSK
jgi:hypothetical protein